MPDTRFSLARLGEHFRRRALVYVIVAVVMFAASDLLYLATRPQTENEALVKFYVVDTSTGEPAFDELAGQLLQTVSETDPSVQEIVFESFSFDNIENADQYTVFGLLARLASGDADVLLCNQGGYEYLTSSGAYQPLDTFLAEGWLEDYPIVTEFRENEAGETEIVAIRLDGLKGLEERGCMYNQGGYLMIAASCTNIENTLNTVEELFRATWSVEE